MGRKQKIAKTFVLEEELSDDDEFIDSKEENIIEYHNYSDIVSECHRNILRYNYKNSYSLCEFMSLDFLHDYINFMLYEQQ
jgi:hypothetical protein